MVTAEDEAFFEEENHHILGNVDEVHCRLPYSEFGNTVSLAAMARPGFRRGLVGVRRRSIAIGRLGKESDQRSSGVTILSMNRELT